mgnify:CR=1 FL=1
MTVLNTSNLTIDFGGFVAINNVNFSLEGGEKHAIIGPNGAGKTTFFNLITGCLLYTSPSPRDLSTSRMPSSA